MEWSYAFGALLLAVVLAGAVLYTRHRGRWQRAVTDASTRQVYREEEQRRVAKGEP